MKIFSALEITFGQYSQAIRTHLSKIFSNFGQKYNNSTVFGQIITVMESTVQNILLYIEDAFVEQNKFTATRKKSIYGLAQLTGYNPSLGKAASAQVKITYVPTNAKNLNVIIPNHTPLICSQTGLSYQIVLPQDAIVMSVTNDNSSKYLHVVEGQFETQRFVASGGPLYLQHVDFHGDVDEDYIEVRVNNELWTRAECLYDMKPNGAQWFYKTSIVGGIILGFGNNVYGCALEDGDVIEVTYLRHAGELGNINASENVYFAFANNLKDITGEEVDANSMFNITLANTDNITSGTFSESQDQVKQMIGYNSRALVLASPDNYKTLINRFSFCGYNRTWSDVGSLVVNSLIMRNYKSQLKTGSDYFSLNEKDFLLTDEQKQSVINCIVNSGHQLAGVTYNILDPQLCKYALYIYVKLKSSTYDKKFVSDKIRECVGGFFSSLDHDNYIPKSDIITLINAYVGEVEGINCYFLSERNETAIINGSYVDTTMMFNPSTGAYVKKTENVMLYPGEDPGLGLDAHGNILLTNPDQFPILSGGWRYMSSDVREELTDVNDPIIIEFE